MSWAPLPRLLGSATAAKHQVVCTISVSKPGKIEQRIYLTLRPHLLPDSVLPWWTYERPVSVEVGQGEHAGRLRVSDNGPHRIMAKRGAKPSAPLLQIAGVPGMPEAGLPSRDVAWEVLGDALIVILPWTGQRGATKEALAASPSSDAVTAEAAAMPASAAPSDAPPPPGLVKRKNVWTEDRVAVLKRGWPLGVPSATLVAELNAMPGATITVLSCGVKASELGLRRPAKIAPPEDAAAPTIAVSADVPKSADRSVAKTVPTPAPARPVKPQGVIVRPYCDILKWAIDNGVGTVAHGFELEKVNERRLERNEPAFPLLRKPPPTATARSW